MAARRLLIVMLVLLGLSTLAAAMVGTRPIGERGTGSTIASETETEAPAPPDTVPAGRELPPVAIEVGGKVVAVPMRVGDQLALAVRSKGADQVEIPALGLLEPVAPAAPARFDLLAEAPGSYGVRLVAADRLVARIEVAEASRRGAAGPVASEAKARG